MLATQSNKQIVIVDGDVTSIEPLRHTLGEAGFVVRAISDVSAAIAVLAQRPPHLVIFDWAMPGLTALDLIRGMRRSRSPQAVKLIILSSLTGEQDVVTGLNMGVDDYIAKPFALSEVVARVRTILRCHPRASEPSMYICDHLVLDGSTNQVTAQGRLLNLRGAEFRLLECLMSSRGRILNRFQLLEEVWGGDGGIDERTVDVNVRRLRNTLAESGYDAYIQTVRGFGYRFASPRAR